MQATSNTNHNGPDGGYSGRLTATAGHTTVPSAIGVNRELESYDLTVAERRPRRQARPRPSDWSSAWTTTVFAFFGGDAVRRRSDCPRASTSSRGPVRRAAGRQWRLLRPRPAEPSVDQGHHGLARRPDYEGGQRHRPTGRCYTRGRRSRVRPHLRRRTPRPVRHDAAVRLQRRVLRAGRLVVVAARAADRQRLVAVGEAGRNGSFAQSPYFYGQVDSMPGVFPTGFLRAVRANDLAVVDQSINATSDRQVERVVFGSAPDRSGGWSIVLPYGMPVTTKLLVDDMPVIWSTRSARSCRARIRRIRSRSRSRG